MRTVHRPISAIIGCSASTARGTPLSCAINTATAAISPAAKHATVNRLISPKPEKRHIPRGTPAATNTAR